MSGGHFNYAQYHISEIADEINRLIESNGDTSLNEYGDSRGYGYSPRTIAKFKKALSILRKASVMAQRIDWLVSGDDGEEAFHERWNEELNGIMVKEHK